MLLFRGVITPSVGRCQCRCHPAGDMRVGVLGSSIRRFDDFVRELARFNDTFNHQGEK